MPNHSVEVDLQFDLKDYVRASTRLMFTRPSFLILLALTGGAVLYGIYFVIINAGTMGFVAALLSQVPFLVLGLVPVVLWLSLRRQGAPRDPAGQRKHLGRHRGGVHHARDGREGPGMRGRLASHHHPEHGTRSEAHGHEGPGHRRALQGPGHGVVERPVEGAGGDQGDDLRGRPPVRRVSQPARPRWPCSPR